MNLGKLMKVRVTMPLSKYKVLGSSPSTIRMEQILQIYGLVCWENGS